ncbi:serine/threonine protein kinase [Mycobacterium eburneum]|nr:serine/threonine-protein kinase [Mycobacterium eburneum]TDH57767.1 serine/threonine protein kinase [Mycobacterium eburneum]
MDTTTFGRYQLQQLLGEGGMGQVYRAYDTETRRTVAVKVLPPQLAHDRTFQDRFRREAYAAASLNDPHVVPLHTFGEIDGRLYLDMRLIEGTDLQTLLTTTTEPMDPTRAVGYLEQVASALDAAHAVGLVHRDVKPSNILIAARDFVYLIDFGIARAADETGLTSAGSTIGTFAYMAPERFDTGHADARSDIYSLTCVFYQCLTGQRPFPGQGLEQQVAGHLTKPPPRPSAVVPQLPPGLDDVIATGMAKDPAERYPSASALTAAARAALDPAGTQPDVPQSVVPAWTPPVSAWAPTPQYAPWPHYPVAGPVMPRRGGAVAALIAALLVLLGVASFAAWQGTRVVTADAVVRHDTAQRQAAMKAASDFAVILTSINSKTVDQDFQKVLDHSTGEFRDMYEKSSMQLRQLLIENKAEAIGTVVAAAVDAIDDHQARVLIAVDQKVTNVAVPEPRIDRSRMLMTLERHDGEYLISKVELP